MRIFTLFYIFLSLNAQAGISFLQSSSDKVLHQNNRLQKALSKGDVNALAKALKKGAQPNLINRDGSSIFHLACSNDNPEIVQIFINARVNVDLLLPDGRTPLHCAAETGQMMAVKKLIQAKASLDSQMKDGATAFFLAAQNGHDDVVVELIRAGADVGIMNRDGLTPLHVASQNGHLKIVEMINDHDEILHTKTCRRGSTPLDLAEKHNRASVVATLKKRAQSMQLQLSQSRAFDENDEKAQLGGADVLNQ